MPRIDIAGYHCSVDRMNIFRHDKDSFLQICVLKFGV